MKVLKIFISNLFSKMHNFSITVSAAVYLQASAFKIFSQFSQKSMKKKKLMKVNSVCKPEYE